MSLEYIRKYYKVPAVVGRRVTVYGRPGVIAKAINQYIGVLFDDEKPNVILPCHPISKVEYLEMGPVRQMTRSQKRYQDYLEYGDCFDSFGDFLRYYKEDR